MSNSEAVGSNVGGTSIVLALLTKLRKQRATSYVVMDLPTLYITFSFTFVRGLCNVRARITSMQHMRAWASAAVVHRFGYHIQVYTCYWFFPTRHKRRTYANSTMYIKFSSDRWRSRLTLHTKGCALILRATTRASSWKPWKRDV